MSRRQERVYGRDEVEVLIAAGSAVIIIDNGVYKLDPWMQYHPGGDKSIRHMIGRDATDEVAALHSPGARLRMRHYKIGRVEGRWKNFTPPIQGGKFRTLEEIEATEAIVIEEPEMEEYIPDDSSESSAASAVFDTVPDVPGIKRRHAKALSHGGRSDSDTSLSSSDEDFSTMPKLSFLDSSTQKEIDLDLAKYPSLEPVVQENIISKYRLLNDRIRAEGLYECSFRNYAIELTRYTILFSLCLFSVHHGWYVTGSLFLAMFWHQLVFTAHDAGHMGITHHYLTDTVIGIIVADFLGGLSLGWWKWSHNVHHIATNHPEHDPDIELMPFFAISHRFFGSLRSTYYDRVLDYDWLAKITIPWQHIAYYPILAFGRFNLYFLSWHYILTGTGPRKGAAWWHRYFELVGQIFFWTWFGYGLLYRSIPDNLNRALFLLVSHTVTAFVHIQITLSHFAMSTADLGVQESFPQRMLRTTMDVDCPEWLDFFHGGLQFQAIHHLFPRMPRHNLRRAQKLVQAFCEEVDIPYALYGFVDGNKKVIGRLGDVGRQATILAKCQEAIVGGKVDHHH